MSDYACHPEWNYDEKDKKRGPSSWSTGKRQSPIDIELPAVERVEITEPIQFINYDIMLKGILSNNGHTLQFIPDGKNEIPKISGGGLEHEYLLKQWHFHWGENDGIGSEHKIDHVQYPAELHLVHKDSKDSSKSLVIGIMLKLDTEGKALAAEQKLIKQLIEPGNEIPVENFKTNDKLPTNCNSFWRYEGSLTTPPCTEGITWIVFTEQVGITHEQLELLRQINDCSHKPIHRNWRPLQKRNGRRVQQFVVYGPSEKQSLPTASMCQFL